MLIADHRFPAHQGMERKFPPGGQRHEQRQRQAQENVDGTSPAARAGLLPLPYCSWIPERVRRLPYDYPRPVSSALYRPEGTSLGKKIQAQAINHPGTSGFYLLPTGLDAFPARALISTGRKKPSTCSTISFTTTSRVSLFSTVSWPRLIVG